MGGISAAEYRRKREQARAEAGAVERSMTPRSSPPAGVPTNVVFHRVRIRPPFVDRISVYQLLNQLNSRGGPQYGAVWRPYGVRQTPQGKAEPYLYDGNIVWLEPL